MTRRISAASWLSIVMAIAVAMLITITLPGCSKKDDKKDSRKEEPAEQQGAPEQDKDPVTLENLRAGSYVEYNCADSGDMTADKRFWCRGQKNWTESESFQEEDTAARDEFIEAWKLGSLDAQQGRDPVTDNLSSRPTAMDGYQTGYINVLDALGIVEYECSEGDETDNEYRDRWCEAASAYNSSRQGSPSNAILRADYINGYMSGRAIALTLPTSMESLFGGEAPKADSKKAIDDMDPDAPKAIKVFYRGFNDGFQAMIDTVKESVNQVMEQMQGMPGMDGMDGMDGMPMDGGMAPPPGMEHMMPPQ